MADSHSHIHHGSALATDALVPAFVVVTALRPPIYWCLFFAANVIGHALPADVELGLGGGLLFGFSVLWTFHWETCFLTKLASSGLTFCF
jgi:hypothetical protein